MLYRRAFLLISCLLLLGGCFGGKAVQRRALRLRRSFAPELGSPTVVVSEPRFDAVRMRRVRIAPPYDTRAFVIKRSDGEVVADFYNGWVVHPQTLLSAELERFLQKTGVFKVVVDSSSTVATPLGIEAHISELLLDHTNEQPVASVRVRLMILGEEGVETHILFNQETDAQIEFDSGAESGAVIALNSALTQVMNQLLQQVTGAKLTE